MDGDTRENIQQKKQEYWLRNKLLIGGLLFIWAVFSFVFCVFLARPLSEVSFFELPLSFWLAQQGTMVVFVVLIFVYAWSMDYLDDQYDVEEVVLREEEQEGTGTEGEGV